MSKTKDKVKVKPFDRLMARYKRYDESQGRGSVDQWRKAFNTRMGYNEAQGIVKDQDPLAVLGLDSEPTEVELRALYGRLMLVHHPDRGGDAVKCKLIIAAYTIVLKRIKGK